jgi:hypothetical protein
MALGKKITVGFFLILVLLLASSAGAAYMLTREVEPGWRKSPTYLDTKEANRKIKLFNQALTKRTRGFVRLSEIEMNALLFDQFGRPRTNIVVPDPDLIRAGVRLWNTNISLYCWEKKTIAGRPVTFAWERVISPAKRTNQWDFNITEMHVGELKLPAPAWPYVIDILGPTDKLLTARQDWLAQIPWIEFTKNEMTDLNEVRLYTYLPASSRPPK